MIRLTICAIFLCINVFSPALGYPGEEEQPKCVFQLPPERDDYLYTIGIGAHKFHGRASTWNEARRTCEEEGAHLAIINSKKEHYILLDLFNKSKIIGAETDIFASLGFHDYFKEGQYVTILGDPLVRTGFSEWALGEPKQMGGEEDCGSLWCDGGLNDYDCDKPIAFFCEMNF